MSIHIEKKTRKYALEKTPNLLLENLQEKDLACASRIHSHLNSSQEWRYWYPEKICEDPLDIGSDVLELHKRLTGVKNFAAAEIWPAGTRSHREGTHRRASDCESGPMDADKA